jgi:hypothetical protein
LDFFSACYKSGGSTRKDNDVLELVGLSERVPHWRTERGMQQRLSLARVPFTIRNFALGRTGQRRDPRARIEMMAILQSYSG